MTPLDVEEFWAKAQVGAADECWPWMAAKSKHGYGRHGASAYAHRIAVELTAGPIPAGHVVMHVCDNPPCVNPNHLRVGTQADNNRDMAAKGRQWLQRVTHCPQGHEYTPDNTLRSSTGRRCKACHYAATNARKRAARNAVAS